MYVCVMFIQKTPLSDPDNIKNNLLLIGKGGFFGLILSGGGFQEDPPTISWGGFS